MIETVTIMPTPAGSVPGIIVRRELGSLLASALSFANQLGPGFWLTQDQEGVYL